jgi:hypothetical protein
MFMAAGLAGWAAASWRTRQRVAAQDDARVDRNLEGTYPASDPPAPHFVDIPVNRR